MNENMPATVKYFERCWLGSLIFGVSIFALTFEELMTSGEGLSGAMVQVFVLLAMIVLILLASRKKNRAAKWILTLCFAFWLVFSSPELLKIIQKGALGVLTIFQILLQGAGLFFLFHRKSRTWFSNEKAETWPGLESG